MNFSPRRLAIIGIAPVALAAIYGGSLAFAQSGEPTTPTPTEDAAPNTPATPDSTAPETAPDSTAPRRGGRDCADKGGSGSDTGEAPAPSDSGTPETTEPETSTQLRSRPGSSSSPAF